MLKHLLHLNLLTITIMLFGIAGCSGSKEFSDKNKIIKYLNDEGNGYRKEITSNGVTVSIVYQPQSLFIEQELSDIKNPAASLVDSIKNKYTNSYYFHVTFSREGKEAIRNAGGFGNYSVLLQKLAFQMHDHIQLTTSLKDTVELGDYFFDQTYGMSNGNTLLVRFDKSKIKKAETLDIHIEECGFGTGNISFRFEKNKLDNAPVLKYL
jgi:hypothetical protein